MASVHLTTFTPILAAIVALMAISSMLVIGFGVKKSFKDGFFLSAIAAIAFAIGQWLLLDGYFLLAFALILAIATAGFGSLSAGHMLKERFTRRQTWQTFATITGLGLVCGWLAGQFF
jgi:hypothetical protein